MARHQIAPAWQTSRGPIVQAHGCAAGVPVAGARVFGETRQNLWSNPSGTISGVTATSNEDGSMTLSGTSTEPVALNIENVMILKPGTTYIFSVDQQTPSGARFRIGVNYNEGTYVESDASVDGATFTTPSVVYRTVFQLSVDSGVTVSGTYRVMLNEGSSAQPWCPPGLTSVSKLGVVSAGTNIAVTGDGLATLPHGENFRTIAAIYAKAGAAYTLSFFNTADWTEGDDGATVYIHDEHDKYDGAPSVGNAYVDFGTITVGQRSAKGFVSPFDGVIYLKLKDKSMVADVMVEEGDADSSYSAPASVTPVDLSGHQLRSLPDGTRDVLAVDGSGAVSVEENAMLVSLDGSSDEVWNYDTGGVYAYIKISGRKPVAQTEENTFANLPIYATSAEFLASNTACLYISPTYLNVRSPEGFKSVQDAREWLSDNPVTAVLMRDKPAITQLDPIAPPSIPAADASLWAASDVPCDLEATTWTASGAEQGRQQAAMVKVAQQVRQQAETVAALTTQALEA